MPGDPKIGDDVQVWITGMFGKYACRVVDLDRFGAPVLEVLHDPSWRGFKLKSGDYILLEDK